MKKLAAILICFSLASHMSGCTSSESRDDDAVAPSEETAAVDSELERVDGAEVAQGQDAAAAGTTDEQLPEQALGEQPAAPAGDQPQVAKGATDADGLSLDAGTAPADAAPPAPATADANPPAPAPEASMADAGAAPAPADTSMAPPAEPVPDASTNVASNDSSSTGVDPGSATLPEKNPAPKASLKKVRDVPFRQSNQLLNAVYVARSGDNYKKISKIIYGDAKHVKDLKSANPAIASVNVGDKVYYNSPNRPTDETVVKNYFEDTGVQPDVYVAKDGDDLKKVAKTLLGSSKNWKELYVTNPSLESKGALVAGTEIHYWKNAASAGAPAAATDVAQTNPMDQQPSAAPAPGMPNDQLPPAGNAPPAGNQMAANNMNPPGGMPPAAAPSNDLPPPPDMNQGGMNGAPAAAGAAAGTTVAEAPPPPPPTEMAPPPAMNEQVPPPPPMAQKAQHKNGAVEADTGGFSNDDMMMGLAAAGILAAGIAAIMVIRKRRQQKEMAAAFGDTQIGAS